MPIRARLGARKSHGVGRNPVRRAVIVRRTSSMGNSGDDVARPWGAGGPRHLEETFDYLINALALATASLRAFCGSTLLKRASWIALRTIWLTSALLGTEGTMSWYVDTMLFASGRALSSIR